MASASSRRRSSRRGWRFVRATTWVGASFLVAAACYSGTEPSVDGPLRYTLVGFNSGGALPVTFAETYTVLAGDLVLRSDGSCVKGLTWRIESDPPVTNEGTNRCLWTRSGDAVEIVVQLEDGEQSFPGRITETGLELTTVAGAIQCVVAPCPSDLVEIYEAR